MTDINPERLRNAMARVGFVMHDQDAARIVSYYTAGALPASDEAARRENVDKECVANEVREVAESLRGISGEDVFGARTRLLGLARALRPDPGLLSAAAIREGLATAPLRSGASVADQVAAMETEPRTAAGRMHAMVDAAKPGDEDEEAEQSLWREVALATIHRGGNGLEAAGNAGQVVAQWRSTFGPKDPK